MMIALFVFFFEESSFGTIQTLNASLAEKHNSIERHQRIASGALVSDEILWELLSRKGQLDRLIAVSTISDQVRYSHMAKEAKSIPGRIGNELENLITQRPDIVILSPFNRPELVQQIEASGIKTLTLRDIVTFEDLYQSIMTLGKLSHCDSEAKALVSELKSRIQQLNQFHSKTNQINVINLLEGGRVMAGKTMANSIIQAAGAINLPAKINLLGWPLMSLEKVAQLDPDFIVVAGPDEKTPNESASSILESMPGWKHLRAAKQNKIIVIPERHLTSISQYAVTAAEILSSQLLQHQGN
jgi:iron complex transport system substrate-binding protein